LPMHKNVPSLLTLITVVLLLNGCTSASYIFKYNVPNITDNQILPTETVRKPQEQFTFYQPQENAGLPPVVFWANGKTVSADMTAEQFLEAHATTAFVVIRNDTILYEKYFDGYSREKITQVFSITKAVTSMLVGIAISEGYIKSVDQPVCDFLPYCNASGKDKLTLNHLLQMTAGFTSDYKAWVKLLNLYYSENQEKLIKNAYLKNEPGTKFAYASISTQMLGMCLEKATGRSFAQYLNEKLWLPLGMEYDAQVTLEKEGGEAKMFSGLSASAIDLAKLGRLYLNNGNWNGQQLIPEDWVLAAREADTTNGRSRRYAYCWWLDTYPRKVGYCENDFFAGGYRGQVVYVNPNDNTIIVRLGKKEKGVFWPHALSKLSLVQECERESCDMIDLLALEGSYQSKKGQSFNLRKMDDRLLLEAFEITDGSGAVELLRDSNSTFTSKAKDVKLIVDYKNQQVKGFILEGPKGAEFFEKI